MYFIFRKLSDNFHFFRCVIVAGGDEEDLEQDGGGDKSETLAPTGMALFKVINNNSRKKKQKH